VLLESQWSKFPLDDPIYETAIFNVNKFIYNQIKRNNGLLASKNVCHDSQFIPIRRELKLLRISSLMSFEIMNTEDCYGIATFYRLNKVRELNKSEIINLEKMINIFSKAVTKTYDLDAKLLNLEQLSCAANYSLDAVVQFDGQGNIVFANQQVAVLAAKSPDELKKQNCDQFINEYVFDLDHSKVVQNYRQVWAQQEAVEPFEYRFKKPETNDLVWVQTILFPIYNHQKEPKHFKAKARRERYFLPTNKHLMYRGVGEEMKALRTVHSKMVGVQAVLIEIPAPSKQISPADFMLPKLQADSDFAGALILTIDKDFTVKNYNAKAQEFFKLQDNQKQILTDLLSEPTKAEFISVLTRSWQNREECLLNVQNQSANWGVFNCTPILDVYKTQVIGWEMIGIDNSQNHEGLKLFSAQSERYRTLLNIVGALNGVLNPRAILRKSLIELANILNAGATLGYLKSNDEQNGEFIVCSGLSDEKFKHVRSDAGLKNLFNYVIEYNKAVIIPKLEVEKRLVEFYGLNTSIKSILVLPLVSEDEIIGAIGILRFNSEAFTTEHIQNCAVAINQIALALRLAKLFETLKRQIINLSILKKISKNILQSENLATALREIFYGLNQEFKLQWLWLGIFSDDQTKLTKQFSLQAVDKLVIVEQEQELNELKNPLTLLLQHDCILEVKSFKGLFAGEVEISLQNHEAAAETICFPVIAGDNKIVGVLSVFKKDCLSSERAELFEQISGELAGQFILNEKAGRQAGKKLAGSNLNLLVAGVAHNFNNLLQGILGEVSLLQMQYTEDETILNALSQIKHATEKGSGLVKELVKLPNKHHKLVESLNLTSVINSFKDSLKKLVSRGHKLNFNLTAEKTFIKIDIEQLREILTQLIKNSVFAMPNGGVINIKTEKLSVLHDSKSLDLTVGEYVTLTVQDNGIGMSQEIMEQCCNPFFTTKSLDNVTKLGTNGSGLGLAIVKSYVENNGGQLSIQSKVGVGTTVQIFFPVT
jgi:signal transduction histidine kinase/PAS domain-containing protein